MNSPNERQPPEISCTALKSQLDSDADLVLLDCREADEFAVVKIEGAVLLPMSEIVNRAGEIEAYRDREIIVYCHHGGRSLRVTAWLHQQGLTTAKSLAGGIDQWAMEIDSSLPRY